MDQDCGRGLPPLRFRIFLALRLGLCMSRTGEGNGGATREMPERAVSFLWQDYDRSRRDDNASRSCHGTMSQGTTQTSRQVSMKTRRGLRAGSYAESTEMVTGLQQRRLDYTIRQ